VEVEIHEDRLQLREFAEAAAPCNSIDLGINNADESLDLADLVPLAGSLGCLTCYYDGEIGFGVFRGLSALSSLNQLTSLCLISVDLSNEEPWDHLAKLTNLRQLCIHGDANGDPSPLSALTRLSSLDLFSPGSYVLEPFSFSSLQPLSTLQQLQTLQLSSHACTATSLQGLEGLSNLKKLSTSGGMRSLEGMNCGVEDLCIDGASDLISLSGIERCSRIRSLTLGSCGVSSLQPLSGLNSLERLNVYGCCHVSTLEGLSGMLSTSLQSLGLISCPSLTHLSGIAQLKALKELDLGYCGVTSLQPLSQLGEGIQHLNVGGCSRVQEVVLELPHVQPTARVGVYCSGVREVVLAGGVVRVME
jgi:hypothetical protein